MAKKATYHQHAAVLAIGTANPPNVFPQDSYPDYYFRMTNSDNMTELKEKFQRLCNNSGVNKRYMYLNEEILHANPNIAEYSENSLNSRQDIVVEQVPRLAKEAAVIAIKEWGQPNSKITHLVFTTTSGIDLPGSDCSLTHLLGLRDNVKRVMMYSLGCYGGGTAMRVAKDLAENNRGSRVLVVCCAFTVINFHGPCKTEIQIGNLVGQALFADGASVAIVGADPIPEVERPLFEIHWAGSNILPESSHAIQGHLREVGLTFKLSRDIPTIITANIENVLEEALQGAFGTSNEGDNDGLFSQMPIPDYNDLFWMVHPGGRAILDQIEAKLNLAPKKLRIARSVLANYGNMSSATVLFVMDEMRNYSVEHKCSTTGEGCEWGVLLGFGPGITVETLILKSLPPSNV